MYASGSASHVLAEVIGARDNCYELHSCAHVAIRIVMTDIKRLHELAWAQPIQVPE